MKFWILPCKKFRNFKDSDFIESAKNLSYKEIADIMKVSESRVKTWIYRARVYLKKFWKKNFDEKEKKEKSDLINNYLENSNESLGPDFTHRVMSQINISNNKSKKLDRKILFSRYPTCFFLFFVSTFFNLLDFLKKTDSEVSDLKNSEKQIVEDFLLISMIFQFQKNLSMAKLMSYLCF